jgi:26S proteasome regulatory subunit T4
VQAKLKELRVKYDKTEDDLKVGPGDERRRVTHNTFLVRQALQSVGQMIGEVLRQLDDERFIVKTSSGPRYVVGCRRKVDREKLKVGTRVALDMTT